MTTTRIPFSSLIVVVLVFATGVSGGMLLTPRTNRKDPKLEELLNEKLSVLQHIVSQMEKLHELREMEFKDLYEARVAVCRARIDLCASENDMIPILQEMLDEAKRREAQVQALPKAAVRGIPEEVWSLKLEQAKVDRLNIEIELERLKSK